MTPELHDLADKIDRLAALVETLRRENADLRHTNAQLSADNESCRQRLDEAQRRVESLLASLPVLDDILDPAHPGDADAAGEPGANAAASAASTDDAFHPHREGSQ